MKLSLDAARLLAHRRAMRDDPTYRAVMIAIAHRTTHEKMDVRSGHKKRQSTRRMHSLDNLPMVRAYFRGPKWRRHFEVREVPFAEVDPLTVPQHKRGRKLLIFTFEEDVRELLFVGREELRPGIYAEW